MKELIEIQKKLHVPKDQKGHKYVYRKVDDILSSIKKVAPENVFVILSDEVVHIGGFNYMKSTATIYNGNENFKASALAKEGNLPGQSDPQISGSCSTYARKKALEGLFALDNDDSDPDDEPPTDEDKATDEQIKKLNDYLPLLKNNFPDKHSYLVNFLKKEVSKDDADIMLGRSAEITGVKK